MYIIQWSYYSVAGIDLMLVESLFDSWQCKQDDKCDKSLDVHKSVTELISATTHSFQRATTN